METLVERERSVDVFYGPRLYRLDHETLADLKRLQPHRPVLAAVLTWFWIVVIVKAFLWFPYNVYLYPFVVFLIAGRAGVFLQLAHEAAHGLIAKGTFNTWFGNWIASYPIGLDLKGYGEPHVRHHACTNKPCDPLSDSEKYRICDIRNPRLWMLFLKDLVGVTAVTVRFLYDQPLSNKEKKDISDYLETNEETYATYRSSTDSTLQSLRKYGSILLVQVIILAALFEFSFTDYFLLWVVPLMTAHYVLMRVRGIAEHGLGIQMGVPGLDEKNRGALYTRSFGTPANHYWFPVLTLIERLLIGSLQVYYHHEHHLFPKVPYYNLGKLHRLIYEKEQGYNPQVFAKGYFACLFATLKPQPSHS